MKRFFALIALSAAIEMHGAARAVRRARRWLSLRRDERSTVSDGRVIGMRRDDEPDAQRFERRRWLHRDRRAIRWREP